MRILEESNHTGHPTAEQKMRCATGLRNDVIKPSRFYDVIRDPNYIVGKPFQFPITFSWLDEKANELDPA